VTVRHWRLRRHPTIRVSLLLLFQGHIFLIEPQWVEVTRHEAWFTTAPPADGLVVVPLLVLGHHEHTDYSA